MAGINYGWLGKVWVPSPVSCLPIAVVEVAGRRIWVVMVGDSGGRTVWVVMEEGGGGGGRMMLAVVEVVDCPR